MTFFSVLLTFLNVTSNWNLELVILIVTRKFHSFWNYSNSLSWVPISTMHYVKISVAGSGRFVMFILTNRFVNIILKKKKEKKETMIWMNNKTMLSIGRILQNNFSHFESHCTDIFRYDKQEIKHTKAYIKQYMSHDLSTLIWLITFCVYKVNIPFIKLSNILCSIIECMC